MLIAIYILILIHGLLLSTFIISRTKANTYLGFFILFLTVITLNQYLSFHIIRPSIPSFNGLFGCFLAPLLYLHLASLLPVNSPKSMLKKHILFNSPFVLFIVLWVFDDYRRKILHIDVNSFITPLIFIQVLIYNLMSVHLLRSYWNIISEFKLTLQYKRLIWGILVLSIFNFFILLVVFQYFSPDSKTFEEILKFIFGSILFMMVLLFWKSLNQPNFFLENDKKIFSSIVVEPAFVSNSSTNKDLELLVRLNQIIREKELFKNPDISLNELAEELNMQPYHLSRMINSNYSQSFFDFINSYRLAEVKSILADSKNADKRINEVMYEVGFNSKSSFNTLFKKHTGYTPSAYRSKLTDNGQKALRIK